MPLDNCFTFGWLLKPSGLKKKFFLRRDPPALDPPLGGYGQNT